MFHCEKPKVEESAATKLLYMTRNEKSIIQRLLSRANELHELKEIPTSQKKKVGLKRLRNPEKRVSFVEGKAAEFHDVKNIKTKPKKAKKVVEPKKTALEWEMYFNELNRIKNEKLHLLEDLLKKREKAR
jgi:anion-transporting  ArsA/GET3 family ATPase